MNLPDRQFRDFLVAVQAGNPGQAEALARKLQANPLLPRWPADLTISTLRHGFVLGRLSLAIDLGHDATYRTTLRAMLAHLREANAA